MLGNIQRRQPPSPTPAFNPPSGWGGIVSAGNSGRPHRCDRRRDRSLSVETRKGTAGFVERLRADGGTNVLNRYLCGRGLSPRWGAASCAVWGFQPFGIGTLEEVPKLVPEPVSWGGFPGLLVWGPTQPASLPPSSLTFRHHWCTYLYEWVLEADIGACFDEIDHAAVRERIRGRISDKKVLGPVKAFPKAGVPGEDGVDRDTWTGTPQRVGCLSPLLANIALSVLDEPFHQERGRGSARTTRLEAIDRPRGSATYRLVRYADNFVVLMVRHP